MLNTAPSIAAPIPSSSLVIVREGGEGPSVLMIERPSSTQVAGGATVFPGGKCEDTDLASARSVNDQLLAWKITAIRETFEECGLLIACEQSTHRLVSSSAVAEFAACAAQRGFFSALEASGMSIATELLVPIAHWITPVSMPRRFDTRFFVVAAPEGQKPHLTSEEASNVIWISPAAALQQADRGTRKLMFPTYQILRQLRDFGTVTDLLDVVGARPISTVTPEEIPASGGSILRIPPDLGYDLLEYGVTKT